MCDGVSLNRTDRRASLRFDLDRALRQLGRPASSDARGADIGPQLDLVLAEAMSFSRSSTTMLISVAAIRPHERTLRSKP